MHPLKTPSVGAGPRASPHRRKAVRVHPGLIFAKQFLLLSYAVTGVRAGTVARPYRGCIRFARRFLPLQRVYSLRQAFSAPTEDVNNRCPLIDLYRFVEFLAEGDSVIELIY